MPTPTTDLRAQPNGGAAGRSAGSPMREPGLIRPGRRVRTTELAAGVATTVLFGLGGLLWHLRSVDRSPVLALAGDVEQGDTLDASDLRLTHVSSDRPVTMLTPDQVDQVIGRRAVTDLAAGTLLTGALVVDDEALGPDEGVLGLLLEPGQYPADDLAAGDVVDVVVGGTPTPVGRAQVAAVEALAGGERKLVSLRAGGGRSGELAALDQSTVRLVRVAP